MACLRVLFLFLLVCCSEIIANESIENDFQKGLNMLYRSYKHCEESDDMVSCLKVKAVKFADRALKINSIPLFEGVTVTKNEQSDDGRSFGDGEFEENSLPQDPEQRDEQLDDLLVNRVVRFIETHSLQFSLPKILDSTMADDKSEEGRGKMKKYMGPMLMAAMVKGGMFVYAMKMVGLLAAKALLVGKIALVLASVVGLKKLFSSGGGESKTIEIVQKPQISHSHAYSGHDFGGVGQGWEPSGQASSGSGGSYGRSFDTSLPYPEAHDLAYGRNTIQ